MSPGLNEWLFAIAGQSIATIGGIACASVDLFDQIGNIGMLGQSTQ